MFSLVAGYVFALAPAAPAPAPAQAKAPVVKMECANGVCRPAGTLKGIFPRMRRK